MSLFEQLTARFYGTGSTCKKHLRTLLNDHSDIVKLVQDGEIELRYQRKLLGKILEAPKTFAEVHII